jgi:hypothetical protein
MAREAGIYKDCDWRYGMKAEGDSLKAFEALVRADERMSFYGQDKPAECADGCPPNQICDYCQVVAPVKAMILAEREALLDLVDDYAKNNTDLKAAIRARGNT